jgi:hypothetical protein
MATIELYDIDVASGPPARPDLPEWTRSFHRDDELAIGDELRIDVGERATFWRVIRRCAILKPGTTTAFWRLGVRFVS